MIKLTKPQQALLKTAGNNEDGRLYCIDSYPPAKKLIALGFAKVVKGRFDDSTVITDAGVEWLDKNDPDILSGFCRELLKAGLKGA